MHATLYQYLCMSILNKKKQKTKKQKQKKNSVAKQNNYFNKSPIYNVAWHAYRTCTYAGSYTHPVHA